MFQPSNHHLKRRRDAAHEAAAGRWHAAVRGALIAAAAMVLLIGCAARRPLPDKAITAKDIHEGISIIGSRHGFRSGIQIRRDADQDIDYTFVRFSLDGVKTRHYSLENLLKGIGNYIAQPQFASLPIKVEIRASEEVDRLFLRNALTHAIDGKSSIDVKLRPASYSAIVIAVARSGSR